MSARCLYRPSLLFLLFLATACNGSEGKAKTPKAETPAAGKTATKAAKDDGKLTPLTDVKAATAKAPDKFEVKFETTKGDIFLLITRDWAPHGADRFYNLVKIGFFDDVAFFRVVPNFIVQFGIHGQPQVAKAWANENLEVDPPKRPNFTGYLTYAMGQGPGTRSTQLFINLKDNPHLDQQGFAPIGRVKKGMDVVHELYRGYGDMPPNGSCPDQGKLQNEGNEYLKRDYPLLDYIKKASLVSQ